MKKMQVQKNTLKEYGKIVGSVQKQDFIYHSKS